MTFARSSIVEQVLLEAWCDMREVDPEAKFHVVVVDSRPLNEGERDFDQILAKYTGRLTISTLTRAGIPCTYTLLPLASSVLPRANLVLLGASALHSDGSLYSRAGTAVLSMLAKENRVPVVACVETYKFGERVALDGVSTNEIGDPLEVLLVSRGIAELKTPIPASLTPLSLMYDLTPPSLITTLCTEVSRPDSWNRLMRVQLGFIPPSSVPTVLGKSTVVI